MNFVSTEFPILLGALLALLFLVKEQRVHKWLILCASCTFYAWWDWRFLTLLIGVAVMDYTISNWISRAERPALRRTLLLTSILVNLTVLGTFKYYNFFSDTFNSLLDSFGLALPELAIILPIGISFYTFETLSYTIDVYRGHIRPARSLLDYAVFLTFFPRLVSGPIMRASRFLPQLERGVQFSKVNFLIGMRLIGQGLVKKVVIADTLGAITNPVFNFPTLFDSATVWVGVLAFTIQVYCDFSGYSDMAIGTARLLGFEIAPNFDLPYTSRNAAEFWRRWHISLSTWFRDYVFFPLRRWWLRRFPALPFWLNVTVPTLVTMLLSGLWHGANWIFVLWGGLWGLALSLVQITGHDRNPSQSWDARFDWLKSLVIFLWGAVTFALFRSSSISSAIELLKKLLFVNPEGSPWLFLPAVIYIALIVVGGWVMRSRNIRLDEVDPSHPAMLPWIAALFLCAFLFAAEGSSPFIYFQF